MDAFKTRQKYKPEIQTCLCFSVMGQRRFRISMGALIASPEAGDASINIIPQMKKCSAITDDHSKSFFSTMSEKDTINQSALLPAPHYNCINIMSKSEYDHVLLMENTVSDEMSSSTIHDNCQFPYYRSKNSSGFPDAVLVKDIGVSCMLLNPNVPDIPIPETNNLAKQLKREYNDLSNITSKITAYTKDILNYLSKKNQRKNQLLQNLVSSKHAIASQYIDSKGNLCLKLRLISNAETQCGPKQFVKESDSTLFQNKQVLKCTISSKNRITYRDEITTCEESIVSKHEKEVQTIFSGENVGTNTVNSLSHSSSSIYNYLMMKKKRTSNDMLKSTLTIFGDMDKHRSDYKSNHKEHLKRCHPVTLTNWREISRSKQSKHKVLTTIPDKSRGTSDTKEKILKNQFFNSNAINNVSETKFHTVNIRIVKHSRKHV